MNKELDLMLKAEQCDNRFEALNILEMEKQQELKRRRLMTATRTQYIYPNEITG